jgi:hypothetical protein
VSATETPADTPAQNRPEPRPATAAATGAAVFCDQCGEPAAAADGTADSAAHAACGRRRELEPPRYCARCRRRMVVQVTPRGWTAKCVEHGVLTAG